VSFTPAFSIVIPTLHRPARLADCLRSLTALNYPRDRFEVVVVDDGASPVTEKQVADVARDSGIATQYVARTRVGPARARNAGARVAHGRFLAFTDDDCVVSPDWLTHLEQGLVADGTAIVGGQTLNGLPDVVCSTASQFLIDYLYGYFHVELTGARFFTTNNLAVTAERFAHSGGFDESFPLAAGEDREFCERWQREGGRLIYAERAVIHHLHLLNLWRFTRQHVNYGRGAHFLQQSRTGGFGATRLRLEPLSFYVRLVTYPFTRETAWRAVPLSGLMVVSQFAYAAGYLYQRLRRL
jgi:GT2 family glycosyltransferase